MKQLACLKVRCVLQGFQQNSNVKNFRALKDISRAILFILISLVIAVPSFADSISKESDQTKKQDSSPFSFSFTYKSDVIKGVKGAFKNDYFYLGNIDAKLNIDGQKFLNLPNSSIFLYVLNNHGSKPNHQAGTIQGIDDIEVDNNTTKIYQLWFQLNGWDDRISLLSGLYDLNSEFYVTDSSSLFIHPAFGIGPEFGSTGVNGSSIFPVTSFGVRLKYQSKANIYMQSAVLDGVPGNPDNPHGTHIKFANDDGTLLVSEIGITSGASSLFPDLKASVGSWRYSSRFPDQIDIDADGNPLMRKNKGYYFLTENTFWHDKNNKERSLKAFLRMGKASGEVNPILTAFETGFVVQGLINNRSQDLIGIGFTKAKYSRPFRELALQNDASVNSESAYEISYKAKVNDFLNLQPIVQYIKGKGYPLPEDKTAFVGLRFEINL